MDWKREAASKLINYEAHRKALQNIPMEIQRLKTQLTSIRSASADGTAMPGGGNSREDAVLSNIVHREMLECRLKDARLWCRQVENALSVISEEDRRVLDVFYIHRICGAADRLAEELHTSPQSVYRVKAEALRRFTIALYGCTED